MAPLALPKHMKRAEVTSHGMRSTFKDQVFENTDFPGEICEMMLAHLFEDAFMLDHRQKVLLKVREICGSGVGTPNCIESGGGHECRAE